MKIAYISPIYFSDVDLSYLSYMQAEEDISIDYFIPITKNRLKGAAINISKFYPKSGIFSAKIYPEITKFNEIINIDRCYVINRNINRHYSFRSFIVTIKLLLFLVRGKYDVIHLTEFPNYYEWLLYIFRKKIVLTVHDPIPHSCSIANRKSILFNRYLAFKILKNFIILNKSQKESFIELNKLYKKNIYISALSIYSYLNIYKLERDSVEDYVLFFGQITSHKGLDILLPAFFDLQNVDVKTKLIIAGRGDFDFDVSKYLNNPNIILINRFIPDEELAVLIQKSKFVICPYKDATQSGVIMSAYAFNKPVIATDVGALPEMVLHNELGLIIEPNNVDVLRKAIFMLLSRNDMLTSFAKNIRKEYVDGPKSWSSIVARMKCIYKDLIKND